MTWSHLNVIMYYCDLTSGGLYALQENYKTTVTSSTSERLTQSQTGTSIDASSRSASVVSVLGVGPSVTIDSNIELSSASIAAKSAGSEGAVTSASSSVAATSSSAANTGAIIGGTIGGAAALAAFAALIIWRRRQKKKGAAQTSHCSFKVLGSSVQQAAGNDPDAAAQPTASAPSVPATTVRVPGDAEDSGDGPEPSSTLELMPVMYQPYRPMHVPAMTLSSGNVSLGHSELGLSPHTSLQRPGYFPSYASSMAPTVEGHDHAVFSSEASSPALPGPRGSKFAELDGLHLSSRSGPVPDWKPMTELP